MVVRVTCVSLASQNLTLCLTHVKFKTTDSGQRVASACAVIWGPKVPASSRRGSQVLKPICLKLQRGRTRPVTSTHVLPARTLTRATKGAGECHVAVAREAGDSAGEKPYWQMKMAPGGGSSRKEFSLSIFSPAAFSPSCCALASLWSDVRASLLCRARPSDAKMQTAEGHCPFPGEPRAIKS